MTCCLLAAQQPGGRQQQGPCAHGGDVLRACAEATQGRNVALVTERLYRPKAPGDAKKSAFSYITQSRYAGECDSAIALDGAAGNRGERATGVRQASEHLERTGKVQ